jgi:hypothetical protein
MLIAIAYSGGCYGTYLNWVLDTLSHRQDIVSPFTSTGSSHQFSRQISLTVKQLLDTNSGLVRVHPKDHSTDSLSQQMNKICEHADSVIYLYPDSDSELLVINNYTSKIWTDWWHTHVTKTELAHTLRQSWPVELDADIDQVAVWIKREFMSYYLFGSWRSQVEWYHPDRWQHDKCLTVSVWDLLYNFTDTVANIVAFTKMSTQRPVTDLVDYHQTMLSKQQFLEHDHVCKSIVEAVVNDRVYHWSPLSLVSEAYIQDQLRQKGYHLRCDGLDLFPTDSVTLRTLTYKHHEPI